MFFSVHFLNMDISVNMAHTAFKFEACVFNMQMEGNFDLGHSFIFY